MPSIRGSSRTALSSSTRIGSSWRPLSLRDIDADGSRRSARLEALEADHDFGGSDSLPAVSVLGDFGVARRALADLSYSRTPCESRQLRRTLAKKAAHAARVAALLVLVADGHLYESMQKTPAGAFCPPPNLFPLVVASVELAAIEKA